MSAVCCRHGMNQKTLYRWRQIYGGLARSEAVRLKTFEDENALLKRLIAGPNGVPALGLQVLRDHLRNNS
jgi:transposase-like protein